jgi:hypothetical protein
MTRAGLIHRSNPASIVNPMTPAAISQRQGCLMLDV